VAKRGETCGALTGAIMATGLLVGREKFEDKEQLQMALATADQVYLRFKKEVGHTLCSEIHKIRYGKTFRLYIPEEGEAFHNMGGHSRTGCPEVCGIGARIAAEIILEIKEKTSLGRKAKSNAAKKGVA
jgi:C_GCAxxG_C_C family probable redox protein